MQSGDVDWLLARDLTYRALDGTSVTVPAGSSTDGASVPRVFSWLVPRSGRYLPAATVHDHCYRLLVPARLMSYQHADRMLLEGMRLLRVEWLTRWVMFAAVRLAGIFRGPAGRRGWSKDAARVIPIAVLTAPITLPVSLVVGVGLLLWHLAGWLAYPLLLAFEPRGRYVNPPADLTRSG